MPNNLSIPKRLFPGIIIGLSKETPIMTINNVQPLTPEELFDILKTEFPAFVNEQLGSNLAVEFAHVSGIINISFPEIIEGTVFTVLVSDDEIVLTNNGDNTEYNTELLEEHLTAFLTERCS